MARELTRRQRFWLAHVRAAAVSGESLQQYAKRHRLSLYALYNAKSVLKRSGLLSVISPPSAASVPAFVAVRMEANVDESIRCRLQHAQWQLEMERLPDPQWLRALVRSEDGDAAA